MLPGLTRDEILRYSRHLLIPEVGLEGQRKLKGSSALVIGTGGLVLLAGEAGQGKSRLLREVAAGADWRGAQVSWGRGREDAQALPFGALWYKVLDLIR